MRILAAVALMGLLLATNGMARDAAPGDQIQIEDVVLTVPDGWYLKQDAKDVQTVILGFRNGEQSFALYARPGSTLDMHDMFVNGSRIVEDVTRVPLRGFEWDVLKTEKSAEDKSTQHVAAFKGVVNGNVVYGFAKADSRSSADTALMDFLDGMRQAL